MATGEDPKVIEVAYRGGVLVPAIDLWMDPRVPRGLSNSFSVKVELGDVVGCYG